MKNKLALTAEIAYFTSIYYENVMYTTYNYIRNVLLWSLAVFSNTSQ